MSLSLQDWIPASLGTQGSGTEFQITFWLFITQRGRATSRLVRQLDKHHTFYLLSFIIFTLLYIIYLSEVGREQLNVSRFLWVVHVSAVH